MESHKPALPEAPAPGTLAGRLLERRRRAERDDK